VHVVVETLPSELDVGNCVSNLLSVSSRWATGILGNSTAGSVVSLSAYGRKISFRSDAVGNVADVEFFMVDKYPDWRMPRPWIMGGFPYYFRVTISMRNMSVVKGYTDSM